MHAEKSCCSSISSAPRLAQPASTTSITVLKLSLYRDCSRRSWWALSLAELQPRGLLVRLGLGAGLGSRQRRDEAVEACAEAVCLVALGAHDAGGHLREPVDGAE